MAKRFASAFAAFVLAVGMLPLPAFAEEPEGTSGLPLQPGTYVEHEAIAYVVDGSQAESGGIVPFSLGGDVLAGAEELMAVDAEAAAEALGDEAAEGAAGDAAGGAAGDAIEGGADQPAAEARALAPSDQDASDEPAGRLVLVRDESKTTEELIATLEADPRVVFAEPNALIESFDEEGAAEDGTDKPDSGEEAAGSSDASKQVDGIAFQAVASTNQNGADGGESTDGEEGADGGEGAVEDGTDTGDGTDDQVTFGADPNEPATDLTRFQWGMCNDGAMGGVPEGDAIDIGFDHWNDASAVSSLDEVVVAVIDTGVDGSNPDLENVLWNEGGSYPELIALGGDAHGYSTVPGTTSTDPISADEAHGTHVAGIIAAEWNSEGVSGVAPNVEIMSVRNGADTASDILKCINYVTVAAQANVNVRVANCSWGMGSNATRAFDVAFTQMGREGVVAVFASGNSDSDMDATLNTISTLRDNPYVVVVDSIDASGEFSVFSCYGQATTDVVAPGTTILSTWPTSDQQYLGEEDENATLYESFDDKTLVAQGVKDGAGAQVPSGAQALLFSSYPSSLGGGRASVASGTGVKRFDGDAALELGYSIEDAIALGADGYLAVQSNTLDLSGVTEKPRYLSIRMNSECASGEAGFPQVQVSVPTTDGGESDPLPVVSEFGIGGGSWSGYFVELPQNTNFANFHVTISYINLQVSMQGGQQQAQPADGTIYVDGIGLGSDRVPYKYTQGTSMAAPAVAGIAAVLAGMCPDDSAAQLAARVKGAAQGDAYAEWCSTGGYATVDGADNNSLSPVPVAATASEDGKTITVRAYFVPRNGTTVSVGGAECPVQSYASAGTGGDNELVELTVQAPEGFAGGETWVEIKAANGTGRMLAQFEAIEQGGAQSQPVYYDEPNLPVPAELDDWGGWQLVGFAGDVYALPQENEMNYDADHGFMMKYDTQTRTWSRVPVPSADQLAAAGVRNVASMAGTTYQGSLVVQITSNAHEEGGEFYTAGSFWRYTVDGTWEHIPVPSIDGTALSLSALSCDGESLYVFGGKGSYGYPNPMSSEAGGEVKAIFRVDLEAGAAEQVGEMARERHNAQVAYHDGIFLVGGGQNTSAQEASSMGVERLRVLAEAETLPSATGEMVEYPAGSLVNGAVRMSSLVTETGELAFSPAAVEDGFMIVGPRCDEGKGVADTYTVSCEEGALPQTYGKLASDQRLLAPSALAYDGKLYVLAATTSEPYRVFSATAVETVAQPGDYVAPEPGFKPGGDKQEGTFEKLASTGDSVPLAPFSLLAAFACLACVATLSRIRK